MGGSFIHCNKHSTIIEHNYVSTPVHLIIFNNLSQPQLAVPKCIEPDDKLRLLNSMCEGKKKSLGCIVWDPPQNSLCHLPVSSC